MLSEATNFTAVTPRSWPIIRQRIYGKYGSRHEKRLCYCQGIGKHGGYWRCGGVVEVMGSGSPDVIANRLYLILMKRDK